MVSTRLAMRIGRSGRNWVLRNADALAGKGSPLSVTNGSASFWKKPNIRKSLKQETEGCVPASPRAKPARARQARVWPVLRIGSLLGSSDPKLGCFGEVGNQACQSLDVIPAKAGIQGSSHRRVSTPGFPPSRE